MIENAELELDQMAKRRLDYVGPNIFANILEWLETLDIREAALDKDRRYVAHSSIPRSKCASATQLGEIYRTNDALVWLGA